MSKSDDEHQKLIDSKRSNDDDDDQQPYSSRLEWAESSWTRCFYLLCWWWMSPVLSIGFKRSLTDDDLDDLPTNDKSSILLRKLQSQDWTTTSTWKIMIKIFWKDYLHVAVMCFPYLITRMAQPLLLRYVIINIMSETGSSLSTYILAVSLSCSVLIQAVLNHQINFCSLRIGLRVRSALVSYIYTRLLSMKSSSWQQTNSGQIINLISNDVYKFEELCSRLHILWEASAELIIIFAFLCWIMRPIPALVSYATLFLLVSSMLLIGHIFGKYRQVKLSCNDKRIHAYKELIHAADIIKMYNWEKSMEDRIRRLRHDQSDHFQGVQKIRAMNISQSYILVPILALTTFGTAWLLHYPLNVADCFAVLSFFSLIRGQFMFLIPIITERLRDAMIASERIDSFVRLTTRKDYLPATSSIDSQTNGRITMTHASFSWHEDIPCLSSLSLIIEPGTLVGISGPVGSGKSSLFAAILDEMNVIAM